MPHIPVIVESFLIITSTYVLLCWAFYLPYRAGQLYMGPVYCMCAGAYFAAFVAKDLHWPIWLALAFSPVIGALFAFGPALGLRRAPGFTTAIASLALIFIIQTLVRNLKIVGGNVGYFGIPMADHLLPTTLAIVVVAGLLMKRIDNSLIGRAAETLFYNRDVGASTGVNIDKMGIFLQTFAGALSGIAGGIFTFNQGALFYSNFGFSILLNIAVMNFLGGTKTIWGVVVFAPIMFGFPLFLPEDLAIWANLFYGALLVIVLIWRPDGVITKSVVRRLSNRLRIRRSPA